MNNFTKIEFGIDNLDNYLVRKSILKGLEKSLKTFNGKLLDVGCGKMPYKKLIIENSKVNEYVGLDIEGCIVYDDNIKPDVFWDGKIMPFSEGEFDTAIAIEVLEHSFNPSKTISEIAKVLKKNGVFFFTVPFLWNLHEVPNDAYRYTPYSLQRLLYENGFREVEILSQGGWHSSLAQMLGMWVRRAPINERKRSLLSKILKPIIKKLIDKESDWKGGYGPGLMITGLYGIAKK